MVLGIDKFQMVIHIVVNIQMIVELVMLCIPLKKLEIHMQVVTKMV